MMIKKHPIRFFLLVLLIQLLLVFSLNVMARSEEIPVSYQHSGHFSLLDSDQNSIPDHLAYTIQIDSKISSEPFWLCGELQALFNGNWQTIAYTGRQFYDNNSGDNHSGLVTREVSIYFYGGEIKRLKVNGPFRLIMKLKGVGFEEKQVVGFSPSYKYTDFEASDIVWSEGRKEKTSEVLKLVQKWAEEQNIPLGDLEVATFNFDRWRFDYQGFSTVTPKRVWVEPRGEISWINMK